MKMLKEISVLQEKVPQLKGLGRAALHVILDNYLSLNSVYHCCYTPYEDDEMHPHMCTFLHDQEQTFPPYMYKSG